MKAEAGPRGVRGLILGAALLIAAVAAMLTSARPQPVPVRLVRVTRSSLVVPVLCAGRLEPPPGGELRTSEGGFVKAILVRDGDRVRRGQPLVELDAPDLVSRALAAREELHQLREARAAAETRSEAAGQEAAHRRRALEADARLLEQAAIARSVYEADELASRQAEARRQEVAAQLESLGTAADGPASRLGLATARVRDLVARVEALTVRAPADGVVYGLASRVGETVAPGQVVASVTDPERPRVRLRVEPPDLPALVVGQRLVVTFDGLPDRQWEGRIESVRPGLRDASGRELGDALGTIDGAGQALPFAASVNVRVLVGERPQALVVPRGALQREGARRFVYLARGGRAERRDVSVGLVGLGEVEVTAGLAEGDDVVLPGEVALAPGVRIAPAP